MENDTLEAAPTLSVIQRTGREIEERVLRGELEPGTKLNEQSMAQQLGVSRGALREALRWLEASGLIEVIPNRGAFVRRMSLQDALHLYDIRAGLARTAGRLVSSRISSAELQGLFAMHEAMSAASKADDLDAYHEENLKFHQQLAQCTGNPRLQRLDSGIAKELGLFMRRSVFTSASARRSCFEHGEMLAAIRAGDAERAGSAYEAHILTGKQRILDSMAFAKS
ncbi:MAG TPA: GntR family transcriptional regulator [Ramlibacter sp.]|jgi:DNA-binding GntR family transcriptional regulator|nr:GntR family transcriptional regulator [Ramlibacter sp.]